MTYDQKQTIIEIKRKELIQIVEMEGCMVYNAIEFAIEEYILGLPCDDGCYYGFKEHFEKRCLKYQWSPYEWKYGNSMTEVLLQLFDKHISKAYTEIKKYVYEFLDTLEKEEEEDFVWIKDVETLNELLDYYQFKMEVQKTVVDNDWNILPKKKLLKK